MVREDAVGDAVLDQIGRDVGFVGIDETADDLVAAIELGDGAKLVLVEEALDQRAVDLLPDAPVLTVDELVDAGTIGELDAW